jgi:alanine racemase
MAIRSPHVQVTINLSHVRAAAEEIRHRTGVKLIAVIKADAYGLGAVRIADALASVAGDFAYFSLHEAQDVRRPGLILGPPEGDEATHRDLRVRPSVTTLEQAARFPGIPVAIKVDTSGARFGCPPAELDALTARCEVAEFWTHATRLEAARRLREACASRGRPLHAALTVLLNEPEAWLDGVRPGVGLYQGAVRVTSRLQAVHETKNPVGYSGFVAPHVGIFLAGYSNGVRPGPVLVNGRRQQILETGMNTSYVSIDPADPAGAEVVLLGDDLHEDELASHFGTRPHEVLCRYTSMGPREYITA